ncbi:hypothetical protein NNJEOMEG_01616 [Fundidesulfovibrio magnetotacticus]|uniref:Uncharacterized protein n=1 Tax=Fundidesulfovibrio magnetotacticus TaxID=2730080 RepID=A0A6V8LM81_9BACT|nr:hypothetical protein [Fundidesulfovibrio magnetotacticus]GFK93782.1 hypothetical protein NNJEOMEG_01616 [Fundidesulfovibrio magnetotacticus]
MRPDLKKQLLNAMLAILAGVVLLAAPEIVEGTLKAGYANGDEYAHSTAGRFIAAIKHPAELLAYLLVGFPFLSFFVRAVFKEVWEYFLMEPTEKMFSDVSQHLKNVSDSINGYTSKQLPYEALEQQFTENAYGVHSYMEKQSLYHYVAKNILQPFCKTPHRSMMEKRIDIRESDIASHFAWHEETQFKIHHPLYRDGDGFGIFPLFWSSSIMSAYEDKHKISILVDNEELIPAIPTNRRPLENESGFFIYADSEWTTYSFYQQLSVRRPFVPVFTEENALSCVDDNVFTATIYEPTYGYTLIMNLPDGYVFKDTPECGLLQLYKGVRERINMEDCRDDICKMTIRGNRLKIEAKGWLLPGIVFNIRWQEKA